MTHNSKSKERASLAGHVQTTQTLHHLAWFNLAAKKGPGNNEALLVAVNRIPIKWWSAFTIKDKKRHAGKRQERDIAGKKAKQTGGRRTQKAKRCEIAKETEKSQA